MRVIAISALRDFWNAPGQQDSEKPLRQWCSIAAHARWQSPADIKEVLGTASVLQNGRVVFNIGGNKYRLVVKVRYDKGIVYVRFIGTHAAYDAIDANTV